MCQSVEARLVQSGTISDSFYAKRSVTYMKYGGIFLPQLVRLLCWLVCYLRRISNCLIGLAKKYYHT